MTLTEFLNARLDEDGALARKLMQVEPWRWRESRWDILGETTFGGSRVLAVLDEGNGVSSLVAEHIARHDPERVLAEVEAKRRLIEAHVSYYGDESDEYYPVPTLSILAAVYADHADYDEGWRP